MHIFDESKKTLPNMSQPTSAMYKRVNARGLFADEKRENLCPIDALNGIRTSTKEYKKNATSQDQYKRWLRRPPAHE